MKRVYEAENGVEAHMLKDMLESEGIRVRVDGEYLQGAAGGLPPTGLVGLSVEEEAFDRAKGLLAAWEQAQPRDEPQAKVERQRPRIMLTLSTFLAGMAVGIGGAVWAYNTPENIRQADFNNDGHVDERYIYRDDRLVCFEMDANSDGKLDYVLDYDRYGMMASARGDFDFNGSFESTLDYLHNNALFEKADTNGDGKVDIVSRYINGVLFSSRLISPETGLTKRRNYYRLGKLVRSEFDANDDGRFDQVIDYDFYELPLSAKSAMASRNAAP
jgi:hypothetical protein